MANEMDVKVAFVGEVVGEQDRLKKELESAREAIADANKRIKAVKAEKAVLTHIEKWSLVEDYRASLEEERKKRNLSVADISRYPTRYKYRKGKNRGNDKNADWVKTHLKSGGTLDELIHNADTWNDKWIKSTFLAKRRKKSTKSTGSSKSSTSAKKTEALDVKEEDLGDNKRT